MRAIALAILLFTIVANVNAKKARGEKVEDTVSIGISVTFIALLACIIMGW